MRRISLLLQAEAIIAVISGYLISHMSWLGRVVGIPIFHPEYIFMKSWWKTTLIILAIEWAVIFVLWILKIKARPIVSKSTCFLFMIIGFTGLCLTYRDFMTVFEHKLLKEKFHLGGYLFWIGWIISSFYFLIMPKQSADK
ncbi:MAG: hypothetical protein LBT29_01275 [Flavobacteriaceae bacterium]|jgi:hypothetical protein|nr:hypothetical protein [Flavobacteriaceae bacterium]